MDLFDPFDTCEFISACIIGDLATALHLVYENKDENKFKIIRTYSFISYMDLLYRIAREGHFEVLDWLQSVKCAHEYLLVDNDVREHIKNIRKLNALDGS